MKWPPIRIKTVHHHRPFTFLRPSTFFLWPSTFLLWPFLTAGSFFEIFSGQKFILAVCLLMVQIFYTLSMKESTKKRLRIQNDFNFDRFKIICWSIFGPLDKKSITGPKPWTGFPDNPDPASKWNPVRISNVSSCHFRIAPSPWELNAPIAPEEPDMDENQSRTLQDVLGSIYSEFGYSSGVETPATSVAPSRRSSNRSSIRSVHSLKLKRKNRKELIFQKMVNFMGS